MSLPVWEGWIEIFGIVNTLINNRSLPVWEEWIEMIPKTRKDDETLTSLPVWEEWIEIWLWPSPKPATWVSSRMGRVD